MTITNKNIADIAWETINWIRINDQIRSDKPYSYWAFADELKNELSTHQRKCIVDKIRRNTDFGIVDFSRTHSGGTVGYDGNQYHWEIFYIEGDKSYLDPLDLPGEKPYSSHGYVELLGDFNEELDPMPF
jgi:hypothetical protein